MSGSDSSGAAAGLQLTEMGHWQLLVLGGSNRRQPLLGLGVGNCAIHEETEYTLEVWMNRGDIYLLSRASRLRNLSVSKKPLAIIPMIEAGGLRMIQQRNWCATACQGLRIREVTLLICLP